MKVILAGAQYREGDVQLVGGSYAWEGRVEIYMSGMWGTITDSQWTGDDAQTACRKLGYFKPGLFNCIPFSLKVIITKNTGAIPLVGAYFGEGSGIIHLDYVLCSGTEYNLTDCEIAKNTRTEHSEDVGVFCQPGED